MILIGSPDEIRALVTPSLETQPILLRAQESGPCVYYDPHGAAPKDGDGPDYREDPPLCANPYLCKDGCPHLDDPAILCPVKGACYAMQEVARMRDACEAEQDTDMTAEETVYETETPEFVEPEPDEDHSYAIQLPTPAKRKDAWTEGENWTVARADTWSEAIGAYRAAYPDSPRSDKAIRSRWEKLHTECRAPLTPDFAGDTVPVTQCDEPASKGLYGDARALHADMMDGMMCDRPIDTCEPIVRGDRVALVDDSERVGTAVIVNNRSKFASVEFPDDDGPARVYALNDLRRVIA